MQREASSSFECTMFSLVIAQPISEYRENSANDSKQNCSKKSIWLIRCENIDSLTADRLCESLEGYISNWDWNWNIDPGIVHQSFFNFMGNLYKSVEIFRNVQTSLKNFKELWKFLEIYRNFGNL